MGSQTYNKSELHGNLKLSSLEKQELNFKFAKFCLIIRGLADNAAYWHDRCVDSQSVHLLENLKQSILTFSNTCNFEVRICS